MFGFVNVFKPAGPTSTQVTARVRRIYSDGVKVAAGHLGTLDPMAAGVLPIALGKATRLIPLIEDTRKSYAFTVVFGSSTTTADATGEIVARAPVPENLGERLNAAMPQFLGPIEQIPPMFSALHHEGRRLYELARAGVTVERKARPITIYGLRIIGIEGNVARMGVACSEGTYVRTLCEDLGRSAGSCAHMGALLRDGAGPFILAESRTLEEIAEDPEAALIGPESIIPFPTIVLDVRGAADFRAGRVVPLPTGATGKHVFVRDASRTLVGVGESVGVLLAPRKVFI